VDPALDVTPQAPPRSSVKPLAVTKGAEPRPSRRIFATLPTQTVDPNATRVSGKGARVPVEVELPRRIGRFAILRRLGAGGMGTVYAAFDEELARRSAIKLLHSPELVGSNRSQLIAEAQAMARLSHNNVVQVYELGTHERQIFLVMEYVEGQTLGEWVLEAPRNWDEVLRHFIGAGEGLAAAHRAGIVHRDFKPENVLISDDGIPKVADFGLARSLSDASGQIAGTPAYMSPEQHLGKPSDERSDIFSYCVALYGALYGKAPFGGTTYAELRESVTKGTLIVQSGGRGVPNRLRSAVLKGVARDPAERYQSVDEMLVVLRRCLPAQSRRLGIWLAWSGAVAIATVAATALLSPSPGASPAAVGAIYSATYDAGRFAEQAEWVYPAEDGDPKATSIRRIIDLEHVSGPAGEIARRHADELRARFAGELAALGDHYWDDPRTQPFARDFYAQTLIFQPDHELALRRGRVTVGQLSQIRAQAEVSGFSIDQIAAAAPLRRLAKVDEVDVDALLAELATACAELSEILPEPARVSPSEPEPEPETETATEPEEPGEIGEPMSTSAPRVQGPSARSLVVQAEKARIGDDDSEAVRLYSQALLVSPRNIDALAALSDIAFDRGEYDEAAELAERAVQVAPKRAALHRRLGDAYYKLRKLSSARAAFERAVELGDTRAQRRIDLMTEEGL